VVVVLVLVAVVVVVVVIAAVVLWIIWNPMESEHSENLGVKRKILKKTVKK